MTLFFFLLLLLATWLLFYHFLLMFCFALKRRKKKKRGEGLWCFLMRCSWRLLRAAEQGPFDPYRILGLSPNAGKDEIRRAYHRLALRYHPDGGPEGSKERFQAVNEAYEALKSGKWQLNNVSNDSQNDKSHGWDSRMGMYVYEQPGSTTENYVDGRTQTLLRLCVLWTAAFVALRFFLLWVFPFTREQPTVEWAAAGDDGGLQAVVSHPTEKKDMSDTLPRHVHVDEVVESVPASVASVLTDVHRDLDPLRRKY